MLANDPRFRHGLMNAEKKQVTWKNSFFHALLCPIFVLNGTAILLGKTQFFRNLYLIVPALIFYFCVIVSVFGWPTYLLIAKKLFKMSVYPCHIVNNDCFMQGDSLEYPANAVPCICERLELKDMDPTEYQYALSYWFLCSTTIVSSVLLIYQTLLCTVFRMKAEERLPELRRHSKLFLLYPFSVSLIAEGTVGSDTYLRIDLNCYYGSHPLKKETAKTVTKMATADSRSSLCNIQKHMKSETAMKSVRKTSGKKKNRPRLKTVRSCGDIECVISNHSDMGLG